jgi:hypothetical protein
VIYHEPHDFGFAFLHFYRMSSAMAAGVDKRLWEMSDMVKVLDDWEKSMNWCLQVVSAGAALLAAGFWLWSALVFIPDTLEMQLSGPKSPSGYMKQQSRLSAIAAGFAAVSAIAMAASICATL